MTEKEKIRIDSLSEILSDLGVVASHEQIVKIAEAFAETISMEYEIDSYQYVSNSQTCDNCEKLNRKLLESEREIDIYKENVKIRSKCDTVWIEGRTVKYSR